MAAKVSAGFLMAAFKTTWPLPQHFIFPKTS
jgi:hypothetical protein